MRSKGQEAPTCNWPAAAALACLQHSRNPHTSFVYWQAAEEAFIALQFNMGQCCAAGSRTFVHEGAHALGMPGMMGLQGWQPLQPCACRSTETGDHEESPNAASFGPQVQGW